MATPCPEVASLVFRSALHPQLVLNLEVSRAARVGGREQLSTPHSGPSGSNKWDSLPLACDYQAGSLLLGSEGLAFVCLLFLTRCSVSKVDSACRVLWHEIVSGSSRLRADREVVWDRAILTIGEYCGVLGVMVELSKGILILCVPYQKIAFVLASPAHSVELSSVLLTLPGVEPNQPQSSQSDRAPRGWGEAL